MHDARTVELFSCKRRFAKVKFDYPHVIKAPHSFIPVTSGRGAGI